MENFIVSFLNEMFVEFPVFTTVVIMVISAIALLAILKAADALSRKLAASAKERRFQADRNAEIKRLSKLPKLRTEYLLQIPGQVFPENARTFGSRYDNMVVYDETGQKFLGLRTPDLMDDLAAGEFLLQDYWVEFCGPGEMRVSEVVTIDGHSMDTYPSILHKKPVENNPMWGRWLKISQHYANYRARQVKPRKYPGENDQHFQKARVRRRFGILVEQ